MGWPLPPEQDTFHSPRGGSSGPSLPNFSSEAVPASFVYSYEIGLPCRFWLVVRVGYHAHLSGLWWELFFFLHRIPLLVD